MENSSEGTYILISNAKWKKTKSKNLNKNVFYQTCVSVVFYIVSWGKTLCDIVLYVPSVITIKGTCIGGQEVLKQLVAYKFT